MPRPPLTDIDYTAAVEAAEKVLRRFGLDPDCIFGTAAAEVIDAVWPILHAAAQPPACGDYSTHWGCHCEWTGEHKRHGCRCGTTWEVET